MDLTKIWGNCPKFEGFGWFWWKFDVVGMVLTRIWGFWPRVEDLRQFWPKIGGILPKFEILVAIFTKFWEFWVDLTQNCWVFPKFEDLGVVLTKIGDFLPKFLRVWGWLESKFEDFGWDWWKFDGLDQNLRFWPKFEIFGVVSAQKWGFCDVLNQNLMFSTQNFGVPGWF